MKLVKSYLFTTLVLGLALFAACKKDRHPTPGSNGTYKVKFVGSFSAGSNINSATINYGVSSKSFTGLSGTNWTKEMDFTENDLRAFSDNPTKNISFGLQGEGMDENATGNVEIFVNGTSVKKGEGTGTILSPTATYIFN